MVMGNVTKLGKVTEQAVIKHVISKITHAKLRTMVHTALQANSVTEDSTRIPYPGADMNVLADTVMQAAARLDDTYKHRLRRSASQYKWYACANDEGWGVYDKWKHVERYSPWLWQPPNRYRGFNDFHEACEWLEAEDVKRRQQDGLPSLTPIWQEGYHNTTTAFAPTPPIPICE